MVVTRILVHMAILAVVLHLADRALVGHHVPLAQVLLDGLRPGYFMVFALTVACLVNRRPAFLAALFALAFLLTYQEIKHDLLTPGIAILLGILAARLVLLLATEAHEEEHV